ncbi:MAG: IPT/TIG domain-containing protein [Chloroflexi bacterium]|nr:IPT/TIG domain-containing protein [Chloroflexota bacterium]
MRRAIFSVVLALFALVAVLSFPQEASVQQEELFFSETSFFIRIPKFIEYFRARGGVRTFGFPISRDFQLLGFRVQFFQRHVLQIDGRGNVTILNLLGSDLMPFTSINGAVLPGVDPQLTASAPPVGTPNYDTAIIDFVRQNAPNEFQGLPVNFLDTFLNTVRPEDISPSGQIDPAILPLINLEIWGVPISRAAPDPNNQDFVYQRYQRNLMHFDRGKKVTQGLLLAQFFKAMITGKGLPPDLDQQARGSRFYKQWNNDMPNGLNRPNELPDTNMKGAFDTEFPPGMPTPTPTPTNTPTFTPTPGTPTPTPIALGPNCNFDGEIIFVPQTPVAGNVLTITVTAGTSYNSVKLVGPGSPHFIGAGSGGRGFVWQWRALVQETGLFNYDFFINDSQLCVTGFVNPGGATPIPGATATPTLPPPPAITSVLPSAGARPGDAVTISGNNFGSSQGAVGGIVIVGGQVATVSSWANNLIVAVVPVNVTTGASTINVVSSGQSSNAFSYTILPPPTPTATATPVVAQIASISPPTGAPQGTFITISGNNFGGTSNVVFIGSVQVAPTSWTNTSIVVVVPAATIVPDGPTQIRVQPSGGPLSAPFDYTIL